jgi:hypothetical protein
MKSTSLLLATLILLFGIPACGGDTQSTGDGDGDGDGDADAGDGDGDGDWTTVIQTNWDLPADTEDYWCARVTVPNDTWITGFRTLGVTGEHHTVLSIDDGTSPDNPGYACSVGTLADDMLFASGVGTPAYQFPPGVAVHVPAGTKIHLNLHLYTTDAPIAATSGIQITTVPAAEVEQEAEFIFGGTFELALGPGPQTRAGTCEFDADGTVLALWPHQHQLGTHHKVTYVDSGDNQTVLHDLDFSFNEQAFYEIDPVVVHAGEQIVTECTWVNDTGTTVYFGDSSDTEMCFTGFYRYPKIDVGKFCSSGFIPPGF